jgi:CheY-like chemotaxis protein
MGHNSSILLVDDDSQVRQALGELLAAEDYEVALAASGDEAISRLRGTRRIDAVLLDLGLGLENGWDVLRRLTSIDPFLPVVILTSRRDQEVPEFAQGRVALMSKPLDLPSLCRTLRDLTARREPTIQHSISSEASQERRGSAQNE